MRTPIKNDLRTVRRMEAGTGEYCCFAKKAALADGVYRANPQEERDSAKDRAYQPPTTSRKRVRQAQAPPEPTCSKHRDDQCAASSADDSFCLKGRGFLDSFTSTAVRGTGPDGAKRANTNGSRGGMQLRLRLDFAAGPLAKSSFTFVQAPVPIVAMWRNVQFVNQESNDLFNRHPAT